ncbi:SMP-30/gluconolactonase/LRE family protein [Blastococcus sp. KM273129]|uniref:SMP-30/gluconolactonase/LRE family protein n=1 Tax=Blastococcus sp. KM273129 TaxID=2570315 RepID=UPI001F2B036A|nr:SMP-30/gluconolactonase/LRE family protein [Blastococcus sp. KM273129]MCF6734794.1 SMP-30/gluconolactonase/LRE family protein [Blastococcus sp. KM273129]
MRAEQLTGPVCHHGEGPVWSPAWGGLRCVDMLAGDVLAVGDDGAVTRRHVGAVAAALRPRRGGGAVIAVERGFALEAPDGAVTPLPPVWSDPGVRMNDGGCDPDGRFWCGSMAYEQTPGAAALYRLDPDGSVHEAFGGVTVSNGLAWNPDGSLAYYADTATHRIDVLDYDRDAGLTGRRPFVTFAGDGNPDGLTVDAEGGVWVALYGSGEVHRYDAGGRRDAVVELPTPQVTACTLGGPGLDRLFVTTSAEGGPDDGIAGSLFTVDAGVRGLPVREFAG